MKERKGLFSRVTDRKGDILIKGVDLRERENFKKRYKKELKARGIDMNAYYVKAAHLIFTRPELVLPFLSK